MMLVDNIRSFESKQTNLKPRNALNGAANRRIDNQIRPTDKQTAKRNKGKTSS